MAHAEWNPEFKQIDLLLDGSYTGMIEVTFSGPFAKRVRTTGGPVAPVGFHMLSTCPPQQNMLLDNPTDVNIATPGPYQVCPMFLPVTVCPGVTAVAYQRFSDPPAPIEELADIRKLKYTFDFVPPGGDPHERVRILIVLQDASGGGPGSEPEPSPRPEPAEEPTSDGRNAVFTFSFSIPVCGNGK